MTWLIILTAILAPPTIWAIRGHQADKAARR